MKLLSLPEEVLQDIATHFTLAEWVLGPVQTCRFLHGMELRRVDLWCFKKRGWVQSDPALISSVLCGLYLHWQTCLASSRVDTLLSLGAQKSVTHAKAVDCDI